jgi:hypothetical protein
MVKSTTLTDIWLMARPTRDPNKDETRCKDFLKCMKSLPKQQE